MPEATSRALFVALVREVATEMADLQARGWEITPPGEGNGFRFRKTFTLPVSPEGLTVLVKEVRNSARVLVQVWVEEREMNLLEHREDLVALIEPDGYEELLRIHRLLTERMN